MWAGIGRRCDWQVAATHPTLRTCGQLRPRRVDLPPPLPDNHTFWFEVETHVHLRKKIPAFEHSLLQMTRFRLFVMPWQSIGGAAALRG